MQPAWPQHRHTEFVWDCDAERSKGHTTVLPQLSIKVCFVHLFYLLDIREIRNISYYIKKSLNTKNPNFSCENIELKCNK